MPEEISQIARWSEFASFSSMYFFDIKKMFISLDSDKRDHGDSGWVEN